MGIEDIANALNGPAASETPEPEAPAAEPAETAAPELQEKAQSVDPGEKAPASEPEAAGADPTRTEKPKEPPDERVPLPAYLEEKKARREMERELQALKAEMDRYRQHQEQAARTAEQRQAAEAAQFKPSVKYEDDPVEYLRQQNAHLAQRLEERERIRAEQERQIAEQRQVAAQQEQFRQYVSWQEDQFRGQQKDYDAAVEYIRGKRVEQLHNQFKAMGYQDSPDLRRAIGESVMSEFYGLASKALQNQVNPAAALYDIARQWGYTPAQAQQVAQAAQAPSQDSAKLDRLEKGQKAAKSVAAMAGREADAGAEEEEESNFGAVLFAAQKEAGYRR